MAALRGSLPQAFVHHDDHQVIAEFQHDQTAGRFF
jgi:hypothetical protein